MKLNLNDIERPYLIYRGGSLRPERPEPQFKFPAGTLIFSNRLHWREAARGKGDRAFPFSTIMGELLYAVMP